MTDQQAQQIPVESPETAMPAVEQPSPSTQDEQAVPQQEVSAQTQSTGLPEDVKDRTRQEFEKLKQSSSELQQQLREERSRREYAEQVFQRLNPPKVVEPVKPVPIVDPTTGLLNENALSEMQRQAQQAREEANKATSQLQQYQVAQEKKEAYGVHPELNPESKSFNKEMSIETRKVLLDNMTHPEDYDSRQLSFKEAADMVKERFKPMIDQATKQGAQQAIEKITPKEQASLEVTGTPTGAQQISTDAAERLRVATRKGGEDSYTAIMQRMKGIPTT